MLYELLVGALPFDSKELRAGRLRRDPAEDPRGGAAEAEHAVEHARRARRPSRRAGGPSLPTLQRQLRGDLDWITMKALENRSQLDGHDAGQCLFATELARWLLDEGEPLIARALSSREQALGRHHVDTAQLTRRPAWRSCTIAGAFTDELAL